MTLSSLQIKRSKQFETFLFVRIFLQISCFSPYHHLSHGNFPPPSLRLSRSETKYPFKRPLTLQAYYKVQEEHNMYVYN